MTSNSECRRAGKTICRKAGPNPLFQNAVLVVSGFCALLGGYTASCVADEAGTAAHFHERVQPILETYCYACHSSGERKGGHAFDEFKTDTALVGDTKLWLAVLKNVRAGLMPPRGEERPTKEEQQRLFDWIELEAFGVDPADPDPGRVTLRRLNRVEYRNTIRDLMGIDYDTSDEFPADDSGYGFDNIGDVLSVSPLLMEKYLRAAERIVEKAVPTKPFVMAEEAIAGSKFRSDDGKANGERMSYYTSANVSREFRANAAGTYHIRADLELDGKFEFDPGRCRVTFTIDNEKLHAEKFGWADNEPRQFEVDAKMTAGKHRLAFRLEPLVDTKQRVNAMDFLIHSILVRGPVEDKQHVEDKSYRRFFPKGPAPDDPKNREAYAREILAQFARRAYRRPVDDRTVDRLVALAQDTNKSPDQSFETGVGRAMIAVLASPRFLFRVEGTATGAADEKHSLVDEHTLASRLSYLLWSTMPDDELFELADRGQLRANLTRQVARMLKDPRSDALAENFVGQWLRSRDVEHAEIDAAAALGRDREIEALRERYHKLRDERDRDRDRAVGADNKDSKEQTREEKQREQEIERLRAEFRKFRDIRESFTEGLRRAMRQETEMYFEHIVREDRSVLELIDSNYTFLNEELAKHYGIAGVTGKEMRRVELPAGSPRGGVLSQGTLLVVTSNPTRTSPVKRGLYILENILGTPPPSPPPNVPPLEDAGTAITDHQPTVRELQERHRRDPLCSSCHARMDPLGLALENFNAMGMWRDTDHDRPIDASGKLLTGEGFNGVSDVKKIIMNERRLDFYRCMTEKLLTYALGRGLEYYDEHTVDKIVERLEREHGKFSALLLGVIQSAPFQKQRRADARVALP
jgi:hypothetical protein